VRPDDRQQQKTCARPLLEGQHGRDKQSHSGHKEIANGLTDGRTDGQTEWHTETGIARETEGGRGETEGGREGRRGIHNSSLLVNDTERDSLSSQAPSTTEERI
jgi:hypothetical protein